MGALTGLNLPPGVRVIAVFRDATGAWTITLRCACGWTCDRRARHAERTAVRHANTCCYGTLGTQPLFDADAPPTLAALQDNRP